MTIALVCMAFIWILGTLFTAGWLYEPMDSCSLSEWVNRIILTIAFCLATWPYVLGNELRRR